jgi:Protein of unknown function (DUF1573)
MFSTRCLFVLGLLLACPALASAQLRFTQPSADLGELRGGPVYDHRFDFVNDSVQTLEITDIRLGCGCLQPVLEKRVFAPGEKGSLRLNIRTLGQPSGARTWQAHVQYRHRGELRETTLILAASIRNEITIEPSILAMSVETALKQEITITDHRSSPCKVKAVLASSPAIHVTVQPTDNGVTRVLLKVSAADLTAARSEEMVSIYFDDPFYRELQVPITLLKANRPTVSATPEQVEIVGAGSQIVRLRANSDKAVRIEKAEANNPGIKCTWAAGPGNDATLKISATGDTSSSTPARVIVHLAEPAGATVILPVVLRKD